MKKYVTIAIILVVVIAAHIFFIRPLFSSKPEVAEASAEKVPVQAALELTVPVRKTYIVPSKNPRFGKFFDYRNAVWDNKLPFDSKQVRAGILIDLDAHKVLWAKNPRTGVPIASMTKMMTLLLVFEAMDARSDLDVDTPIKVTASAAKIGGSQVYLDVRETHPLGELLKTMAIKSANDSAYLVAEYVGNNNVTDFVHAMNKRAYELRMPNTEFINPDGLPDNKKNNCLSSPEGMAILAEHLLQYPLLMQWFSTKLDYFRPKESKHCQMLTNTNHVLLGRCPGVDGMKTGYTKAAGFCITATCLRNGKRLVAVVAGFKTSKSRNAFVSKLLNWGYGKTSKIGKPFSPKKVKKQTAKTRETTA